MTDLSLQPKTLATSPNVAQAQSGTPIMIEQSYLRRADLRRAFLSAVLFLLAYSLFHFGLPQLAVPLEAALWLGLQALLVPTLTVSLATPSTSPFLEAMVGAVLVGWVFAFNFGRSQWVQWLHLMGLTFITCIVIGSLASNFGVELLVFPLLLAPLVSGMALALFEWRRVRARTALLEAVMTPVMAPKALKALFHSDEKIKLDGSCRRMTSLVCRIRDVEEYQHLYRDHPEALRELLDQFYTLMTEALFKSGGCFSHALPDGFSAYWNAPMELVDHETRACDAALGMVEALDELNQRLDQAMARRGLPFPSLAISIGIATATSTVGIVGKENMARYAVTGSGPTLAHRLSDEAERLGTAIAVAEHTAKAVQSKFALLGLDLIDLGEERPGLEVFSLVGNPITRANPKFQDLLVAHDRLFSAYRSGNLKDASAALDAAREASPSYANLYDLYENRIQRLRTEGVPEQWPGFFRRSTLPL